MRKLISLLVMILLLLSAALTSMLTGITEPILEMTAGFLFPAE